MFQDAKKELEALQTAKANLESQLDGLNSKIDAMTKTYNAIAPLVGQQPIPTFKDFSINAGIEVLRAAGISVAVHSVIESSPQEIFTAASVRDRLAQQGWNWGDYVNPLATVHTVLVRLAESGAIKETTKDGRRAFHSTNRLEPLARPLPRVRGLGIGQIDDLKPVPGQDAIRPLQSVQGLEQTRRKK